MRGRALPFFLGSEWGGVSASPLLLLRCLEKEKKKQRVEKESAIVREAGARTKDEVRSQRNHNFFPLNPSFSTRPQSFQVQKKQWRRPSTLPAPAVRCVRWIKRERD